MNNWADIAASMGAPVFPIRIEWNGQKWTKRPLTKHGHKDASHDVSRFDWSAANGFGINMGDGLLCLDLDSYKEGCQAQQWLTQWQVPTETRVHCTVSGGWHLIYRTRPEWHGLGNRQHVVPGLDTRGKGGWIAFGAGYSVANDASPALLHDDICFELSKAHGQQDVKLQPLAPVDAADVQRRLQTALTIGRPSLRHRWAGDSGGLHDVSRSGMDMSCAKLLALAGFSYSEIYWLLCQWPHGVVGRDGVTRVTHRQLCREAARATQGGLINKAAVHRIFGNG